jgi:putative endonuclease
MWGWFQRWRAGRSRATGPAHLRAGEWGEAVAERFLRQAGYRVLGRRVRVGRRDEIDLIVRRRELLVFVEVKTRASERMGRPVSAVNRAKRFHLGRAAMRYMQRLPQRPPYFRFDVVEVVGTENGGPPDIRHLENVFTLPAGYRVHW